MKRIIRTSFVVLVTLLSVESVASAQLLKKLFGGSSSTTTTTETTVKSEAYNFGQTAGTSLKALFSQYKADGKKLDMSNTTNLLNLASLAGCIQGLKSSDAAYRKDYAKGLVLGSTNLVTDGTSSSVVSKLTSLANIDLSSLTNNENLQEAAKSALEAKASEALSKLTSSTRATETAEKAEEVASKASATIENATEIANSVSSILSLFK